VSTLYLARQQINQSAGYPFTSTFQRIKKLEGDQVEAVGPCKSDGKLGRGRNKFCSHEQKSGIG